jgi:lipooligosaccharide transport system permease protein
VKTESFRLPTFASGILQIWKRSFRQFRRSWLLHFFWIVLEPALILLAIGYGLGTFVSNMQGISFADFFFPALLCMSSMMVAFFEGSYGNFSKLNQQNTYATMILTSLEPRQIVIGEVMWAATKGTLSALIVALIAGFFGHLDSLMMIPSLAVIFLSSFVFGAVGMMVTCSAKSYDAIIYSTSGFIVPMALFCGTYFPLEQLPYGMKYIFYAFPLTHSVALVRALLHGSMPWWQMTLHIAVLVIFAVLLLRYAIQKITQKLVT